VQEVFPQRHETFLAMQMRQKMSRLPAVMLLLLLLLLLCSVGSIEVQCDDGSDG